jgi:hypothetical protein
VNIKIAGKWMFIPLKMVLIGIDPYPCDSSNPVMQHSHLRKALPALHESNETSSMGLKQNPWTDMVKGLYANMFMTFHDYAYVFLDAYIRFYICIYTSFHLHIVTYVMYTYTV